MSDARALRSVSTGSSSEGARELERIERALDGDVEAVRALVRALTPVVQARVARVLLRSGAAWRGSLLQQDVADLTQDVLASLFAGEGRALRSWDPDVGALAGFVGMIAEREAISRVRRRRRNPMTESPTEGEALERAVGSADAEEQLLTRSTLAGVLAGLERVLSPLGLHVFRLLFVEEADVETACRELSMSAESLYQWRTRIRRAARELATRGPDERAPAGGEAR